MTHFLVKDKWVFIPQPVPGARLRLFCLPFAGGGANAFRDWPKYLPPSIELCAVEIPGRGSRLSETLEKDSARLIAKIHEGIQSYLDRPFALFGHSMGSLLGFELAHHFASQKLPLPIHLFLSGRGAPTTPSRDEPIHALPENEFLKRIREYNGTPKEIFEHQELMQLMIPILRADFEVCETYRYQPRPALTCPITIFGGLRDSGANRSELEAWREMTSGAFRLRMFPGDHFYLLNSQATVVHTLVRDLHESMTLLNQS